MYMIDVRLTLNIIKITYLLTYLQVRLYSQQRRDVISSCVNDAQDACLKYPVNTV